MDMHDAQLHGLSIEGAAAAVGCCQWHLRATSHQLQPCCHLPLAAGGADKRLMGCRWLFSLITAGAAAPPPPCPAAPPRSQRVGPQELECHLAGPAARAPEGAESAGRRHSSVARQQQRQRQQLEQEPRTARELLIALPAQQWQPAAAAASSSLPLPQQQPPSVPAAASLVLLPAHLALGLNHDVHLVLPAVQGERAPHIVRVRVRLAPRLQA